MKSKATSKEVANALLANLLQGEFPNEEDSQAELTAEGIPGIVEGLERAVGGVKVYISFLKFSNLPCGDWAVVNGEC